MRNHSAGARVESERQLKTDLEAGAPITKRASPRTIGLNEVRARSRNLRQLLVGERLPDWSTLSLADRVAVIVRMLPDSSRVWLVRSRYQAARYERGDDVPLSFAVALTEEAGIPLAWLIWGREQRGERGQIGPTLVKGVPKGAFRDELLTLTGARS